MIHITLTKGDYVFAEWHDDGWKKFDKEIHELRVQGYRKIGEEHDYLYYYQHYRKKGKKKVVTVTMMCC